MINVIKENDVIYNEDYYNFLKKEGLASFDSIMGFHGGKCIKKIRDGSVYYLRTRTNTFYLKRNRNTIRRSIEPLFKLKRIERDGLIEWENICKIKDIGINTVTPVAAGSRRMGFLYEESFIITEDLFYAKKLDNFFRENFNPPADKVKVKLKMEIIYGVADIVKKLHENRLCHQDLYLGHFYIQLYGNGEFKLYLIDLQRVRESNSTPVHRRYVIKDLSQLLFASHYEVFVSNLDRLRFYKRYRGGKRLTCDDLKLFTLIYNRAKRIAEHTKKHAYPLPAVSWQPQI